MKKILLSLMFVLIGTFGFIGVHASAVYDHEVIFNTNGGEYVHQDILDFGTKLDAHTEPLTILAIGDSTSNEEDEWYHLTAEALGLKYEDYSVKYKLYDRYEYSYDETIDIQYGTDGDAYATFDGLEGGNISTLDNAAFSITGDIDLRAKVKVGAVSAATIIGKQNGTGNASYTMLYYTENAGTQGKIALTWSEDGTTILTENSGLFTVPVDTEIWVKATLDVDNGAAGYTASWYYSFDGITYTLITEDIKATGVTSIYDSSSQVEIGSYNDGTSGEFEGQLYNVEIRDGIDGQVVGSLDFDQVVSETTENVRDTEGNTWFINGSVAVGVGAPGMLMLNGSIGGANIDTFSSDILSNLTKVNNIDLIFISLGHNESDDIFADDLEDFINEVKVYSPDSKIVLVTQNPQATPIMESVILKQTNRMDQVRLVAARNNIAIVDAYTELNEDTVTYIDTDGIHPTTAGYIVWADQVTDLLNSRVDSGASEFNMLVEDDHKIIEPDAPTKVDYIFGGWFTNENLTDEWDFATDLVQDDTILYAKWTVPGATATTFLSPSEDALSFFGIAWYWYALVGVGAYFVLNTKDGKKFRKKIGF